MLSVLWSVPKGRIPQRLALKMMLTTVTKGPASLMRCQEAAWKL